MNILFEDDFLIICEKPFGVCSQSDSEEDMVKLVSQHTGRQAYIINRLDKPVGGLVLLAKDKKTASALSNIHIDKYYMAVVCGDVKEKDTLRDYIFHNKRENVSKIVNKGSLGAKYAELDYEKTAAKGEYNLVKIKLVTGRHHQIRLQMASRGMPLYGDVKYNESFRHKRGVNIALYSIGMGFEHPVTGEKINAEIKPKGEIFDMFEKAVIFDLDGTLINSLEDIWDGVNHTLEENGYPLRTIEEIRQFIGDGAEMLIRRSLPGGTSEDEIKRIHSIYKAYYDSHSVVKTRPYDGICNVLEKLREMGIHTAINTNKPQSVAEKVAERFFPRVLVVGADSEKRKRKPAPDGVEEILKITGVPKENCIYVGDTAVDIATGRNSGVKVVGVLWGFREYEDIAHADRVISKPEEIIDLIKDML